MARYEWRDRDEDRTGRRPDPRDRDDFGQADYSRDYAYDPDTRTGYRAEERMRGRDEDYGQADYSRDWDYDSERGRPYRRETADERFRDEEIRRGDYDVDHDRGDEPRSWMDRAGDFLAGRPAAESRRDPDDRRDYGERRSDEERRAERREDERRYDEQRYEERRRARRRGPSDRVIWAVIVERLEDERGLDLRDVEVLVDDGEVTLNGTVRRKEDKRRIEDIADIDGVRHVQNNLRARERPRWTFL